MSPVGMGRVASVLKVTHATRHNLRDLSFALPLGRLVCLTGVSGSGKTTLVRELLLPALHATFTNGPECPDPGKASDRLDDRLRHDDDLFTGNRRLGGGCVIEGWEAVGASRVGGPIDAGKNPRSNPVVYIGAFADIRELFMTDLAKQRGLNGSAFSFNSRRAIIDDARHGFEERSRCNS